MNTYNHLTLVESSSHVARPPDGGEVTAIERDWSQLVFTRRNAIMLGIFVLGTIALLYVVLPRLPGEETWQTVRSGHRGWLLVALAAELGSYACYVVLFRSVFSGNNERIGWRESYEISMAGVVATRLLASAGAGGVALTFWAVRKSGVGRRQAVVHLTAFFVILYGIFMAVLVVGGVLLRTGVVPGDNPFGLTVVPAVVAGGLILAGLAAVLVPGDLERIVARWARGRGRISKWARKLVAVPALLSLGVSDALRLIRDHKGILLSASGWWALDIAVLWACFQALGGDPPTAVVVMAYFVGLVANMLPMPGGIGAVEGGMIGAFVAFGELPGIALVSVLAYRVFAFWLPTIPGAIAFFHLRKTVERWRLEDDTIQSKVMEPRHV